MKQDAHVYGDGICLILFSNDQNRNKPDLSRKPTDSAIPLKLKRLNPEFVSRFEYKEEKHKKNKF